ncbi:MAG: cation:proton antiporter [Paludibacteraceae bacterium]|nr:cation:proton antiporter [Paludibacteraceae bacterium]
MHTSNLISDLALILVSAGLMTILFKWLKQPVVLGYIVAGCLIGTHITYTPTVGSTEEIGNWSEIGVVFLLFALGLEFSFKKLLNMGKTALIASLVIIFSMIILGTIVGLALGWGLTNSVMLGGMISMSSTTIIIKALDDLGLRSQKFTNVVFGILILEDLMAILLMVVVSTMAANKSFDGGSLLTDMDSPLWNILKLLFFLTVWLVFGIYFVPTFLKKTKRFLNEETMLIVSLGMCLAMVMFAVKVNFSAALGAFVMGSILAETVEADYIEKIIKPVKNLFGAIFFVSVGMMIDFNILVEYAVPIIVITLTVICGQVFFATCGILLSGQPLKIAIQSSFSLTQIGEFAYIIASLGATLGLIDDFLYPVIVAVSVITIFVTPFMIKLAMPAYQLIEANLPAEWKVFIERRSLAEKEALAENVWRSLLIQMLRIVLVYSALVIAIIILAVNYFIPFVKSYIEGWPGALLASSLTILLISPFLRAMVAKKNHSKEYRYLWNVSRYNRAPLIILIVLRFMLAMAFISFVLMRTFDVAMGLLIVVAGLLVVLMMISKRLKFHSIIMERKFFYNLNSREYEMSKTEPGTISPFNKGNLAMHLSVYDLHLADFEVSANSNCVGKELKALNYRKRLGVHVVSIIRGQERINIPGGNEQIFPTDKLLALGTDEQLKAFETELSSKRTVTEHKEVGLEQVEIDKNSVLIGKSILQSGIRDKAKCLVVGIEHEGVLSMNPDISTVFQTGDLVWIVGESEKIKEMMHIQAEDTISIVDAQ